MYISDEEIEGWVRWGFVSLNSPGSTFLMTFLMIFPWDSGGQTQLGELCEHFFRMIFPSLFWTQNWRVEQVGIQVVRLTREMWALFYYFFFMTFHLLFWTQNWRLRQVEILGDIEIEVWVRWEFRWSDSPGSTFLMTFLLLFPHFFGIKIEGWVRWGFRWSDSPGRCGLGHFLTPECSINPPPNKKQWNRFMDR